MISAVVITCAPSLVNQFDNRQLSHIFPAVIRSFRHGGLRRLYERGDASKIRPDQREKVRRILARLDVSGTVSDLDVPGFGLHALKGDLKGNWAVTVSRNCRVVFRVVDGDACDVDLIDYH